MRIDWNQNKMVFVKMLFNQTVNDQHIMSCIYMCACSLSEDIIHQGWRNSIRDNLRHLISGCRKVVLHDWTPKHSGGCAALRLIIVDCHP